MQRYGATTIARWLVEKMPVDVKSYIEEDGTLQELIGVRATSGCLTPKLRVILRGLLAVNVHRPTRLSLTTPVILSHNECLAGKAMAAISSQVDRAAVGSRVLPRSVSEAATA